MPPELCFLYFTLFKLSYCLSRVLLQLPNPQALLYSSSVPNCPLCVIMGNRVASCAVKAKWSPPPNQMGSLEDFQVKSPPRAGAKWGV